MLTLCQKGTPGLSAKIENAVLSGGKKKSKETTELLASDKTFTHRSEKLNPVPLSLLHFSSNIKEFSCILLAVGAALRPSPKENALWEMVKFKMHISASC